MRKQRSLTGASLASSSDSSARSDSCRNPDRRSDQALNFNLWVRWRLDDA